MFMVYESPDKFEVHAKWNPLLELLCIVFQSAATDNSVATNKHADQPTYFNQEVLISKRQHPPLHLNDSLPQNTTLTPKSPLTTSRGATVTGRYLPPSSTCRRSKVSYVTFVCVSHLIPALQGSRLGLIHHSVNYEKPLVSRLETCKFFVGASLSI